MPKGKKAQSITYYKDGYFIIGISISAAKVNPSVYLRLDRPEIDKYEIESIAFMNVGGTQTLYAYVNAAGKNNPFLKTSYSYKK